MNDSPRVGTGAPELWQHVPLEWFVAGSAILLAAILKLTGVMA